jgi:hypothetical protein
MIALNTLLVLGIVVNVIKAGDLVLRPHQQRAVQTFFEDITLRLESMRPLEWLASLSSTRGQRWLLFAGTAEFAVVLAIIVFHKVSAGEIVSFANLGTVLDTAAIVLSLVTLPLVPRLGGPRLMCWLVGDARVRGFVWRFMLALFIGFFAIGIYEGALFGSAYFVGHADPFDAMEKSMGHAGAGAIIVGVGLLIAWPPFVYFWILTQVGGLVLWITLLAWVCEFLLKGARGVAWRIVEYNKGAWAALCLLTTVALGLIKLALNGSA